MHDDNGEHFYFEMLVNFAFILRTLGYLSTVLIVGFCVPL